MKAARQVVFPEFRKLTLDEYEDFYTHGLNSAIWSVTSFLRNSSQVREKLYSKGYPKGEVEVEEMGFVDIVELIVEELQEMLLLDDRVYAETKARSLLNSGKWGSVAFYELIRKGVDKELAEELKEKMFTDEIGFEKLDDIGPLIVQNALRKGRDRYRTKTDIVQKLMGKGFAYGMISEWLEENFKED